MMKFSELRTLIRSLIQESSASGKMEQIWRDEGIEAETLDQAAEMYAWELGYQSRSIPDWLLQFGQERNIDVVSQFNDGKLTKLQG